MNSKIKLGKSLNHKIGNIRGDVPRSSKLSRALCIRLYCQYNDPILNDISNKLCLLLHSQLHIQLHDEIKNEL